MSRFLRFPMVPQLLLWHQHLQGRLLQPRLLALLFWLDTKEHVEAGRVAEHSCHHPS